MQGSFFEYLVNISKIKKKIKKGTQTALAQESGQYYLRTILFYH